MVKTASLVLFLASFVTCHAQLGGGYLDGGLLGMYYPTTEETEQPAFQRRDVRIRFDDLTTLPPGGCPLDRTFNQVTSTKFHIVWQGRLVPRFSESYTLFLTTSGKTEVHIRPLPQPGFDEVWRELSFASAGHEPLSTEYQFHAGKIYELRILHSQGENPLRLILEWSAPSFPREVIDTANALGMNHTEQEAAFTDAVKCARSTWESLDGRPVTTDENGWPLGDAALIVSEYLPPFDPSPLEIGINRMMLDGTAEISVQGNYELLGEPWYDPSNGLTTAQLLVRKTGSNIQQITFRNAKRSDGSPGISGLRIMRPVSEGSVETFAEDTLFHPALLQAYSMLTAIRFQRVNDQTRHWHERVLPSFFRSNGKFLPYVYAERYGSERRLRGSTGMPHEYEIMLCNATGKDYFLSLPHLATVDGPESYVRKLALLIKHGSDGREPYETPVPNPVYPPLNSNLNVYLEIANELWNFASLETYSPYYDLREVVRDMAAQNTEDFKLLNFDNLSTTRNPDGSYTHEYTWVRRYWALQLKRISDVFREIFGNQHLPGNGNHQPRIRPYFGWQYNNANDTAIIPLDFLDRVFNNSDGVERSSDPRPPAHFIFAGGGAGYYSFENKNGFVPGLLPEGGFEIDPPESRWQFSGSAGIASENSTGLDFPVPPKPGEGRRFAWLETGPGADARLTLKMPCPPLQHSDVFGLSFRWVHMSEEGPDERIHPTGPRLRVLVNGRDVTYRGAAAFPRRYHPELGWRRINWWPGDYYFSETFRADPALGWEITFEADADSPPGIVFLDDVKLTSIDAFYAQGLGSGAATGQSASKYITNMQGDARWASAYGLEFTTYEHGYSAGGDAGNSPLQDHAKFLSDQARLSVIEALEIFQKTGGRLPTFGTYSTWPSGDYLNGRYVEGILNAHEWPLSLGMKEVLSRPPTSPDLGTPLPAALREGNASLTYRNDGSTLRSKGSWLSWIIVAPETGDYQITVETSSGGSWRLYHGALLAAEASSGQTHITQIRLTAGQHGLRLINVGGSFRLNRILIDLDHTADTQPAKPGVSASCPQNGSSSQITNCPYATGPHINCTFWDGSQALSNEFPESLAQKQCPTN